MEATIRTITGEKSGSITLPRTFEEPYRPDLIRKAFSVERANKRQPYGPSKNAGMRHSVSTWGKGRGVSRVQRLKQGRAAAESPNNVGGRRCHPPVVEKDWSEKINKKEFRKAIRSAVSATILTDVVRKRGHRFEESIDLPLVIEGKFESLHQIIDESGEDISYTKKVKQTFESLGVGADLIRAKEGRHIRAGRGKLRGRKYRVPRSLLVVLSEFNGMEKAIKNLAGVEVTTTDTLTVEKLAPGGDPGRLTIYTEQAIRKLEGM
jgi:large subunit ribosomal protein L4e